MDAIPLQRVAVPAGDRSYEMLVPEPGWIAERFRLQQEAGAQPPLPYWSRIWHSATALAAFLPGRPELVRGKAVLELAAGLGLPGRVAAGLARSVVVSDYLAEAVDVLEQNIAAFGLQNMSARQLDWNALPADLHADLLLLSDVNYEPAAFAPLLLVIREFLERGTIVLLATPQRIMAGSFIEQVGPWVRETTDMAVGDTVIKILLLER